MRGPGAWGAVAGHAVDEQSCTGFWKSCYSLFTSQNPPTLAWLDTRDNALCPSRLSFLGLAGEVEVLEHARGLRPKDLPHHQHPGKFACYDKKEMFNHNFNYSITKTLSAAYRDPASKAHVLCPPRKPVSS